MKLFLTFLAITCIYQGLFAQVIKGTVYRDKEPLPYASVKIYSEVDSLIGSYLTNHVGYFESSPFVGIPTFLITASYMGTDVNKKQYSVADLLMPISIYLETKSTEIDTVSVFAEVNPTQLALNKRVYKFQPKDFIKHTTADMAIHKVPGVVFGEGIGLRLDGFQTAQLYIDGIAANLQELKNLEVEDIEQVELISNPTAKYNAESNAAIIQIITKKTTAAFYKGRIGLSKGILLERTGFDPSFSYKKGQWLLKTALNYSDYKQETFTEIFRNPQENSYFQYNDRETKINTKYANIAVLYNIDSSSSLFFKSQYYGYQLAQHTMGKINGTDFVNNSQDNYWIYTMDLVYDKQFKQDLLSIKGKYNRYTKDDLYTMNEEFLQAINSGLSDLTVEGNYNHKLPFFDKTLHDFGIKFVNRSFNFLGGEDFNQYNYGAYSNWQIRVNKRLDISPAFYLDVSDNVINQQKYSYTSLLPSLTISLKSGKTSRVALQYRRSVNRPSPMDLNEEPVLLDPTTIQLGSANLRQALFNNLTLAYTNPYKKNFLSANLTYSNNTAVLFQNIAHIQDTLIYTKENSGNIQRFAATLAHDLTIGKGMSLYTSVSANYNKLDKGDNEQVITAGYGFLGTINFSALLFKKLTTSLLFDYNSRRYDLYSTTIERPFTSLLLSSNIFKDKFNLRLTYVDLFGINGKREILLTTPDFSQRTYQNRNFSNINFSITYLFGKKFSDAVSSKVSEYDDLELRK